MPELTIADIDAALERAVEVMPHNCRDGSVYSITIGPLQIELMGHVDAEALAQRIRDHIRGCLEN